MNERALFLDRDGVINVDVEYAYKVPHIKFIDGIFPFARTAHRKGYKLVIITNQAGIGRGYYTERDFHELMKWMAIQFALESASWDAYYFCPHHPEFGKGDYKIDCDCRKPKPGMLLKAKEKFGLDMAASILVGDKETDIEAGKAAGVGKNILVGKKPDLLGLIDSL